MSDEYRFYVYVHKYATGPKKGRIFYVGKGCGFRLRSRQSRNPHWHNVVNKYGFVPEVYTHHLTDSQSLLYERIVISYLRDTGSKLVNRTDGGEIGPTGMVHTEKSRKKMSESRKGENCFWWGKTIPEETREKIRAGNTGKAMSDESRLKMSLAGKGRTQSNDHVTNKAMSKAKPVITNCGLSFCGAASAARWLMENGYPKARETPVTNCCKGRNKSAYGFIWEYVTAAYV